MHVIICRELILLTFDISHYGFSQAAVQAVAAGQPFLGITGFGQPVQDCFCTIVIEYPG